MKKVLVILYLFFSLGAFAQHNELADNSTSGKVRSAYTPYSDTIPKKTFSNSDQAGIAFIVSSNVKENLLQIKTNYDGEYKIRFVDYYARTRIVFKHNRNNISLDLNSFDKSIFIMCITDSENRTLTSQVINLKRRHL